MTLLRLARELDETAEQSARMAGDITEALRLLAEAAEGAEVQKRLGNVLIALQRQDRIEQRCRALAQVARHFAVLGPEHPDRHSDPIWAALPMDELRLQTQEARPISGEVELF